MPFILAYYRQIWPVSAGQIAPHEWSAKYVPHNGREQAQFAATRPPNPKGEKGNKSTQHLVWRAALAMMRKKRNNKGERKEVRESVCSHNSRSRPTITPS
ncbi:hypothetical protein MGG_15776 [Pyricularia oryzae 70-15]|uniref:Uncharacterized protein n=1 Tax=Pyricularia oryzae (strain 70-15 / ATCC MYA-4617 / FGSC 8958) TaxID=242507 RepID=G4MW65_PYRO7|nr:uncharacterized protein MGG_15776 [Pyricularia oryzae 70-15]EHA55025.1 hypothetical protein MGG_15776 [Pyricularia oryzae 70-15]